LGVILIVIRRLFIVKSAVQMLIRYNRRIELLFLGLPIAGYSIQFSHNKVKAALQLLIVLLKLMSVFVTPLSVIGPLLFESRDWFSSQI